MTVKYKLKAKGVITKDGHTMFPQDIVTDLNRKSFLEDQLAEKAISCSVCGGVAEECGCHGEGTWARVDEALPAPGGKVIAHFKNRAGMGRTIMAKYLTAGFEECSCEYECNCEWDEKLDCSYYPKGWYELVENCAEWGFVPVDEGVVTHWMPLPKQPE